MYSVIVYASWDALAKGRIRLEGTFALRGAAMEAADSCAYPIVDVRDIGEAGRCPARPHLPNGEPQGHRFREDLCADCQARAWDLYIHLTYIPREPTNGLIDGPWYAPIGEVGPEYTPLPSWGERGPQTEEEYA